MAAFTVYTQAGKALSLKDENEIHRGGEGRILSIQGHPGLVAKIYHPGIVPITQEKYNFLNKLDANLFVIPQDLLTDKKNIVGFTMEFIPKDFFPISSLFIKNFGVQNQISENTRRKILQNLTDAVAIAHKQQMVIGDLNQYNILVNAQGEIRLIDVDSYQTPGTQHSGALLEDIRDYLHGGGVNIHSDFFALSVMIFYALTFVHPFKGIHKKYKSLQERMIHKLPVFVKDADLIVPKCYEPLADAILNQQFERMYLMGERFRMSFSGVGTTLIQTRAAVQILQSDELHIRRLEEQMNLINVWFDDEYGYIQTRQQYIFYHAAAKGQLVERFSLSSHDWDEVFVHQKHIYARQADKLFYITAKDQIREIKNFRFSAEFLTYQLGEILMVISPDAMHWIYLGQIMNTSVLNKRIEVFGRGFYAYRGLVQSTGGKYRLFYHTGKDIATVKTDFQVKEIIQHANIAAGTFKEGNKIQSKYIQFKGLEIQWSDTELETLPYFAYMPTQNGHGFVFEPAEGNINIRRTEDFNIISSMNCEIVSAQSYLYYTKAGILVWEGESMWLVNRK